jgi:uncharacterized protein (TIGR00661 family)
MRILYGVGGEGNGHAMRSMAVIEYLRSRGHEVEVCTSGIGERVLAPLAKVHRVLRVPLAYRNGALAYSRSLLGMAPIALHRSAQIRKVCALCRSFRPDVIVSDYETFTAAAASRMGIPHIAANNISVITHARYANVHVPGSRYVLWFRLAELLATGAPDLYVIPSFFPATPRRRNVTVTPPPIRSQIRRLRQTERGPVLVYQTSPSNTELLDALHTVGEKCIVYGYGARARRDNLVFAAFSERRFLRDLARAKAVVLGGGFTLITEAIFLRKPILSVPMRRHYEQCLNAAMVERLGYGRMAIAQNVGEIRRFFGALPRYRGALARVHWDPDAFAKEIERRAMKLAKRRK